MSSKQKEISLQRNRQARIGRFAFRNLPLFFLRLLLELAAFFSALKIPKRNKLKFKSDKVDGIFITAEGTEMPTFTSSSNFDDWIVLLNLHGGAFVIGNSSTLIDAHKELIDNLQKKLKSSSSNKKICIFSLDYALCPRQKYPKALVNISDAYQYLYELGFKNIVLIGDSAGGNLVLSFLYHWKNKPQSISLNPSLPLPLAVVVHSPWVDLDPKSLLLLQAKGEPLVDVLDPDATWLKDVEKHYLDFQDGINCLDPRVNPLYATRKALGNEGEFESELILPTFGFVFTSGGKELFEPQIMDYVNLLQKHLPLKSSERVLIDLEANLSKDSSFFQKNENLKLELLHVVASDLTHDFAIKAFPVTLEKDVCTDLVGGFLERAVLSCQ